VTPRPLPTERASPAKPVSVARARGAMAPWSASGVRPRWWLSTRCAPWTWSCCRNRRARQPVSVAAANTFFARHPEERRARRGKCCAASEVLSGCRQATRKHTAGLAAPKPAMAHGPLGYALGPMRRWLYRGGVLSCLLGHRMWQRSSSSRRSVGRTHSASASASAEDCALTAEHWSMSQCSAIARAVRHSGRDRPHRGDVQAS